MAEDLPAVGVSPCAAGMDALEAPAGGGASRAGDRRPPVSAATPSPSVTLAKGTKTPFRHHHCAHVVGFVSVAVASGFWFLITLS